MSGRFHPGDKFRPSAEWLNRIDGAAESFRNGRIGRQGGGELTDAVYPTTEVFGYRDPEDDDLGELCPVKLRQPDGEELAGIEPADAPLDWQAQPVMLALSPEAGDEGEAVGITAAPIKAGAIGRVYTTGTVICTVDVTDTGHEFATLTDSATKLTSAASGTCRILRKETTEAGEQSCVVLLNAGSGGGGGDSKVVGYAHVVNIYNEEDPPELIGWKLVSAHVSDDDEPVEDDEPTEWGDCYEGSLRSDGLSTSYPGEPKQRDNPGICTHVTPVYRNSLDPEGRVFIVFDGAPASDTTTVLYDVSASCDEGSIVLTKTFKTRTIEVAPATRVTITDVDV